MSINRKRPDELLRRRLFWVVLGISLALSAASYLLQFAFSYDLSPPSGVAGQFESEPPHYGSYGLYLTRADALTKPPTTVAILSNSVYVTCQIAEQMQQRANAEHRNLRFLNFAQTGSGIYDHLLQMPLALQARPQLVVVAFINLAFSPQNGARSLPKFRTDIDQTAFDPTALRALPTSFYWREFTLNEGGSSIVSTLWPAKRLDWLLRRRWHDFVTAQVGPLPDWFERQFPLPALNLAADWLRAQRSDAPAPTSQPAFPESRELLDQLVDLARARGVALLLLRQESGPLFDTPDVWPLVEQACGRYDRAIAVDLKAYFKPEQIKDQVHPVPGRARVEYAKRHYAVILDALQRLNLVPPENDAADPDAARQPVSPASGS